MAHGEFIQSLHDRLQRRYSCQEISEALASIEILSNDLLVTNIPTCVFTFETCRKEFEELFHKYDEECKCVYLPSFGRAKVYFTSIETALAARYHVDQQSLIVHSTDGVTSSSHKRSRQSSSSPSRQRRSSPSRQSKSSLIQTQPPNSHQQTKITCHFSFKPELPHQSRACTSGGFLAPPKPEKQYLISPPGSPPDDWEPKKEAAPCINYDLLAALSKLAPGGIHELQPPQGNVPGIVLTSCEEDKPPVREEETNEPQQQQPKFKIVQTRCPERHS